MSLLAREQTQEAQLVFRVRRGVRAREERLVAPQKRSLDHRAQPRERRLASALRRQREAHVKPVGTLLTQPRARRLGRQVVARAAATGGKQRLSAPGRNAAAQLGRAGGLGARLTTRAARRCVRAGSSATGAGGRRTACPSTLAVGGRPCYARAARGTATAAAPPPRYEAAASAGADESVRAGVRGRAQPSRVAHFERQRAGGRARRAPGRGARTSSESHVGSN